MLCFRAVLLWKNNSSLKTIKENKGEYKRQENEWVSARLSCVSFSRRGVSASCWLTWQRELQKSWTAANAQLAGNGIWVWGHDSLYMREISPRCLDKASEERWHGESTVQESCAFSSFRDDATEILQTFCCSLYILLSPSSSGKTLRRFHTQKNYSLAELILVVDSGFRLWKCVFLTLN